MKDYTSKCAVTTTSDGTTHQTHQIGLPTSMLDAVKLYLVPPFAGEGTSSDSQKVKRREFFAFLFRDQSSKIHQHMILRDELSDYIKTIDSNSDCWLCPNSFYRLRRGNAFISRMGAIYVDLDYYKTKRFKDCTPEQVIQSLHIYCHEEDIPRPSYIKSSGRGLQILWIFERAIPAKAMSRWRAVEKHFCQLLAPFGSDPAATDPARMLRLEGTINKKNRCYCQPLYIEREFDGSVTKYNFEYLCEWLPEKTREAFRKKKQKEFADNKEKKERKRARRTGTPWFVQVSHDLDKLINRRKRTSEGLRMLTLFWHMNFLALARRVSVEHFYSRARAEAKKIDSSWTYSDQELKTLYERFKAYVEQKLKIDDKGRRRLMLYTPASNTLIQALCISDDELREMPSLQRRGRQPRKPPSGLTMSDRTARAADRQGQARKLRDAGKSIREIARLVGCSKSAVQRYLAGYQAQLMEEKALTTPPAPVSHGRVISVGVATPAWGTLCVSTISRARGRATTCPQAQRAGALRRSGFIFDDS